MKRSLCFFLPVLAVFALAACGSVEPYAASVNGARINRQALDDELKAIRGNTAYVAALQEQGQLQVEGSAKGAFDQAFVARVLTRRIVLELVHQEVVRRKLTINAAALKAAEAEVKTSFPDPKMFAAFPGSYRREVVRSTAEVTALQGALAKGTVTDAAVKTKYDADPSAFAVQCVSHILVEDKAKADAVRAQIVGGADFAALARTESKDNQGETGGSAAQGGSLGCLTTEEAAGFVPEFKAAMDAAVLNEVSQPVQSQFGFHLIKITERKSKTFEEAAPEIRAALEAEKQSAVDEFISSAIAKAKVKVNPRYGKWVKEEGSARVVPPQSPTTTAPAVEEPGDVPVPGGTPPPGPTPDTTPATTPATAPATSTP